MGFARELHGQSTDRGEVARMLMSALGAPGAATPALPPGSQPITIAAPLTADHWREVLELHGPAELFPALRGRRRVADAAGDPVALSALAAEARLSASLRQSLPWLAVRAPQSIPAMFALRDLLWLGKPELGQAELDRWGVYAEGLSGRLVTAMPPPAPWEDFGGRPEGGAGRQRPAAFAAISEPASLLRFT